MDLTNINGTYAKELKEHLTKISQMVTNSELSVAGMKKRVRDIIRPAFIHKNAKPRFYNYLSACRSKPEIMRLCNNTVNKAKFYYGGA